MAGCPRSARLVIYSLLFVVGSTVIAAATYQQLPFMASPLQFAATAFAIVVLCVVAARLPREIGKPRAALRPVAAFFASFVAGSLFMQLEYSASSQLHWPWIVTVSTQLVLVVAFVIAMRRRGWSAAQRFALAAGAFLVYAWKGFETDWLLHGRGDLAGHAVIAVIGCAALAFVGLRARNGAPGRS
jgi:FtsH-binding integral membrane protein